MQTPGTPGTSRRVSKRSGDASKTAGKRSRWRRDLLSVRAAMPRGIGFALGACVVSLLATAATGLADYWRSFAQNTAADLIGAIVAMYVLIPLAQRPPSDAASNGTEQEPTDEAPAVMTSDFTSPNGVASAPTATPEIADPPADTTS